jgi:hypothetical protein
MNTNDLRQRINGVIRKETKSNELKKHLAKILGNKEADVAFGYIKGYVLQTPDIMDSIYGAAKAVGLLDQFQPVFDSVFIY